MKDNNNNMDLEDKAIFSIIEKCNDNLDFISYYLKKY